jgi:hypothetical protein
MQHRTRSGLMILTITVGTAQLQLKMLQRNASAQGCRWTLSRANRSDLRSHIQFSSGFYLFLLLLSCFRSNC